MQNNKVLECTSDRQPVFIIEKITWMLGDDESVNNGNDTHYYHEGNFKYGYPIGYDEGEGPEEL